MKVGSADSAGVRVSSIQGSLLPEVKYFCYTTVNGHTELMSQSNNIVPVILYGMESQKIIYLVRVIRQDHTLVSPSPDDEPPPSSSISLQNTAHLTITVMSPELRCIPSPAKLPIFQVCYDNADQMSLHTKPKPAWDLKQI